MRFFAALIFMLSSAMLLSATATQEVEVSTYDKLEFDGQFDVANNLKKPLSPAEKQYLAGRQYDLCMIGDSVTWAEDGDHFRAELLKHIPEFAFIGTHTAVLGYSHAGEGGDRTHRVLARMNDPERIPNAAYYHLLIGVNDSASAKKDSQSAKVAAETAERIALIVNKLLEKPGCRKVFLGTILPSPFDMKTGASTVRERTGSVVNAKLRDNFDKLFDKEKVVWIEYEKPLRADLANWKKRENLKGAHPTAKGYKILAAIAAPVMKKHLQPVPVKTSGKIGVEVVNLWDEKTQSVPPMLPGWYTLSMELDGVNKVDFTLYSVCDEPKKQFKKKYSLSGKPGQRVELNFMTGYQNFGYTRAPFKLDIAQGKVKNIMVEKMRPLLRASRYGTGTFIDTASPVAAGEKLLVK